MQLTLAMYTLKIIELLVFIRVYKALSKNKNKMTTAAVCTVV